MVVLGFAVWQLWAAGHAHRTRSGGTYRHCVAVETNVGPESMWDVVGDIGAIHRFTPSLRTPIILDGKDSGVGAVRRCKDLFGKSWSEECVAFEPGRGFSVHFLTDKTAFPLPVRDMRVGWEVTASSSLSEVQVGWELIPNQPLLASIIIPMLAFQVDRQFPRVIRRMAITAAGQGASTGSLAGIDAWARLVPTVC